MANLAKQKHILMSGLFLWLFAVIGTGLVAFTDNRMRTAIVGNEREHLLRNLRALLPADRFDNDLPSDILQVPPSTLLGTDSASIVYRAKLGTTPVAAIFNSIALDGYSGRIHLLIGVYVDGSIAGVRVVKHAETPGLGDAIDIKKSSWVTRFNGKTLLNPSLDGWQVKRDGGEFDQFTGATITPRAVVSATRDTLRYYQQNADKIFAEGFQ